MLTKLGEVTIHHNHSWITGAREFAFKDLAELPHVKKIIQANFRQSHIKSGSRDPKVKVEKGSVVVEYFFDGGVQRFILYPKQGLTLQQFEAIIKTALSPSPIVKKGAPVSTSDRVATSNHVHEEISAARERLFPAPKPKLRSIEMSDHVAMGYEALLEKAPSPDAITFQVDHAFGVIGAVCGEASQIMKTLRKLNVIDDGTMINNHPKRKRYKVERVHYTIDKSKTKPGPKPKLHVPILPLVPASPVSVPMPAPARVEPIALEPVVMAERGTKNITVDGDIQELINKVQGRLEADFGFRPTISQTLRHIIKRAALGDLS